LIAVLIGAVATVWLVFIRDDDGSPGSGEPVAASVEELKEVAGDVGHPVYWAGPLPELRYELTRTGDGRVFIRYLGPGATVGDPRPGFLTVASYPVENSFAVLRRQATRPGNKRLAIPGDGLALIARDRPKSAYVAFPGSDVQIEVYAPTASATRRIVTRGLVERIG
jgi:hypothetical protein